MSILRKGLLVIGEDKGKKPAAAAGLLPLLRYV
jgi:hypothetical protein